MLLVLTIGFPFYMTEIGAPKNRFDLKPIFIQKIPKKT